jgi:hypothetical protein
MPQVEVHKHTSNIASHCNPTAKDKRFDSAISRQTFFLRFFALIADYGCLWRRRKTFEKEAENEDAMRKHDGE